MSYTVVEGVDGVAMLRLIRSGYLDRDTVITVTPVQDSALGMYTIILPFIKRVNCLFCI